MLAQLSNIATVEVSFSQDGVMTAIDDNGNEYLFKVCAQSWKVGSYDKFGIWEQWEDDAGLFLIFPAA